MNDIPQVLKEQSRHLQQLIDAGKSIEDKMRESESEEEPSNSEDFGYYSWHQRVITTFSPLLRAVQQESIIEDIKHCPPTADCIVMIRGKMHGMLLDIEQGKLNNLAHKIQKEDIEELIVQAEEYLNDMETEIKGHYLAAMCISIILENAVRKLCEREGIIPENGNWVPLGQLIKNLKDNSLFNEHTLSQLDLWRKIRNDVVHGKFDNVTRREVEGMIEGVKRFVTDYL